MSEWSLFGIEPTSDKRTIKRAYAKLIKTIDPAIDPKQFQEVREAYDYLLNYGRYYVEEENEEQSEKYEEPEVSLQEQSVDNEINYSYSEPFLEKSANSENFVQQETEIQSFESSAVNQQDNETVGVNTDSVDEPSLGIIQETTLDERTSSNSSKENQLVYPDVEFQSQEIATDWYQKTSYQSANEFIEKLDKLFNSNEVVNKSDWISLVEDEEYQFFDVIELLRVEVFSFLVEQIEKNLEVGNQPEKLKLKLLKERLPQDFEWLVKYLAEYFDWENTELILSSHFSGEQMKQLGQFYLSVMPTQAVDIKNSNSNTKHYIFWVIFLVVMVKIFSAMENDSKKRINSENNDEAAIPHDTNDSDIFCSHLKLIKNNQRALKCESLLKPIDDKKRLILAYYWFNQFDNKKVSNKPVMELEPILDRAFGLLQSAAANEYIPAMNLLAWIKLGKHYQREDKQLAQQLLQKASDSGDVKSRLVLAVGYYMGLWGKKDLQQTRDLYKSVEVTDNKLTANLKYVLAAGQWLGLKPPRQNQSQSDLKKQAKIIFEDFSSDADLDHVNSIAWYYATANDESFDPVLAVNLARQFQAGYRASNDWQHIDTLAAAYAARGQYEDAIRYNEIAEDLVKSDYPDASDINRKEALETLQGHRSLFEQSKRIELEPEIETLHFVLGQSFKSLMYIDINNLPD